MSMCDWLSAILYAYLYAFDPGWAYRVSVGIALIIYQRDDAVVLSELDLKLPVSISLIQACALGYDGLNLSLALFLRLLIRGSRALLGM